MARRSTWFRNTSTQDSKNKALLLTLVYLLHWSLSIFIPKAAIRIMVVAAVVVGHPVLLQLRRQELQTIPLPMPSSTAKLPRAGGSKEEQKSIFPAPAHEIMLNLAESGCSWAKPVPELPSMEEGLQTDVSCARPSPFPLSCSQGLSH